MKLPDIETLYDVIDATWPAASVTLHRGWLIRDGQGGGKRVCAACKVKPDARIKHAESAMVEICQDRLFMIRNGQQKLDESLASLGYDLIDPVVLLAAPLYSLNKDEIGQSCDAPNAAMSKLWAAGGIGTERLAVMERALGPKTYITIKDKAVAYVAIHNGIAMAHAVEVGARCRRQGLGRAIMHQVAAWAEQKGADYLSVITVMDNTAARTLYQTLGMTEVGHYHYRIKK
jgi:GNAT superfamily N-acetyltransferase